MKKIKFIHQYWRRVLFRSGREVWDFLDIKGKIYNFLMIIIIGVVMWVGRDKIPVLADYQNELEKFFWIAVFFMPILSLVNCFFVAPIMYKELGGFDENPFDLTPRPPKKVTRPSHFRYASIDVNNNTKYNIENCYLRHVGLIDMKTGKSILEFDHRTFDWGSGMGTTGFPVKNPLTVIAGDKVVCDIATTRPNNTLASFTYWAGAQEVPPGEYELKLRVHGQWKGNQTSETYSFILKYKGGNDLSIEKKKLEPNIKEKSLRKKVS